MNREDYVSGAADLSIFRRVAARLLPLLKALRGPLASPRVRNGTPVETGLPFRFPGIEAGAFQLLEVWTQIGMSERVSFSLIH
ncbi:hypothetical protein FOMPIDRAFT_1046870 [Fomitopsis schrenkii]|uniref:Uncharacterized protein n=1 Tax=Fomitopsis schrenkii TaxID=2126942 RepID=S8FYN9_FOMSC|nr:hypothetical protein FOMPIDRAFT_1046870 [Fomitopsis schrenkii]